MIHQYAQIKETSHFTYRKRLDTDEENSVIDAWHEIQYYLHRAITAKWVKGIFTAFVINLQCKTCEGQPLCPLFVKDSTLLLP